MICIEMLNGFVDFGFLIVTQDSHTFWLLHYKILSEVFFTYLTYVIEIGLIHWFKSSITAKMYIQSLKKYARLSHNWFLMCFLGLEKHKEFVTVDTVLCSEAKYLDYVKQYEKMLCSLVWQYVSYKLDMKTWMDLWQPRVHNTYTSRLSILKVTPAE